MINTSLGTHFSDGLRSGPIYSTQLSSTIADANGVLTSTDYTNYGPGVLHSPQHSYRIYPNIANPLGGFNEFNNVVAQTTIGAVPAATYLTLRGDNYTTFLTTGANGLPLLQFDWPRVPMVRIAGADATAATRVTIIGFDWYGFPLQHTYVVEDQGNYPTIVDGAGANDGALTYPDEVTLLPAKAFFQITKIYVNAALPGNCTISVGASPIFGLPFFIGSKGFITSIGWASQTNAAYPNPNAIEPLGELTTRVVGSPLTTTGIFVPADAAAVSTATTGDVRGLYAPSSNPGIQVIGGNVVDSKVLTFTYYVKGMDTWIDQVANKQQQYMLQTGSATPQGLVVPPLSPSQAYGVPQFYTGVPS